MPEIESPSVQYERSVPEGMEILEEVDRRQVKHAYIASQFIRKHGIGNHRYLQKLSRGQYLEKLAQAKAYVLKLEDAQLDSLIKAEYPKRLKAYNNVNWYIGIVSVDHVGVWKGAGGLPKAWTDGPLSFTAQKVAEALEQSTSGLAARAKRAIPRMLDVLDLIENDSYLYPIVLPGGTMGRKGLMLMSGDIDDGCMRSIALAYSGKKQFSAYIGLKEKYNLNEI